VRAGLRRREGHRARVTGRGLSVEPQDVVRLSPMVFDHIKPAGLLGRYAFFIPDPVQRGELRPLRTPAASVYEVA
jgi:hypothetical protein